MEEMLARDLFVGRCARAMDGLRLSESVRGRRARESVDDMRMSFFVFLCLFFSFS